MMGWHSSSFVRILEVDFCIIRFHAKKINQEDRSIKTKRLKTPFKKRVENYIFS
ncbi:hypothetical protein HanIR_Chr02g0080261 [Helianthus annuus]|nr:hypothetical protein HanIR_Chr02g0080261 [Helianthus annuus]